MKKQNEKKLTMWMKLCLLVAVLFVEASIMQNTSLDVFAQGTAKVTVNAGTIRESADRSSEAVASVRKGDKLDVISQTKDSSGYTWYKVYVDGNSTGYIRADLVGNVTGSIKTEGDSSDKKEESSNSNSSKKEESAKPEVQFVQVTASEATAGKVAGTESVNVRENPSTDATVAGKADEGTEVSISGEAVDSAGKIWYQVSFGNVTGFIHSDYIEVIQNTETVGPEDAEVATEEAEVIEEEVENKEYEVIYEANAEGVEEWFLYDHNRGTKQKLENLLAVVRQTQENEQSATAQLKTMKLLVFFMIAVIVVLIIAVTILVFKLRDAYEYEYEDDEDDEDDEEDGDDAEDDEEEVVVRKPLFKREIRVPAEPLQEEMEDVVAKPVRKENTPVAEKKDNSWQSKNFLDIGDDMEFEFLDLK